MESYAESFGVSYTDVGQSTSLTRSASMGSAWDAQVRKVSQEIRKQKATKVMHGILAVIILSLVGYYFGVLHNNLSLDTIPYLVNWGVIVITLTLISRIYKLIKNYKERKQIGERAYDPALSSQRTSIIPYIVGVVIVYIATRVPFVPREVGSLWPQYILRTCVAALEISAVVYVAIKIYKEVKKGKTLKDISFGAILAGATFLVLLISGLFLSVPWFPKSIVILPLTMFYLGKLIEDVSEDSIRLRESPFFKLAASSIFLTTLTFIDIYFLGRYFKPLVAESLIARFFAHYYSDLCGVPRIARNC